MSSIERAARTLTDDWDGLEVELQTVIIEEIRAMLLAMREPSDAMIAAAKNVAGFGFATQANIIALWQAMVDGAAAELEWAGVLDDCAVGGDWGKLDS